MSSNLFLLIGEDKSLIDFNVFNILNNISYDDNNKIIYDLNFDNFMDVMEEASMVSLFSPIKVIIVNNFVIDNLNDYELDYLSKYINGNNKDVYIIFISNKVDARKKSYKLFKDNFKIIGVSDDGNNFFDYVINRVRDSGYKMDSATIECFLSKVGNDINNINSELDKLFIYKNENKIICIEDVDLLIFDNIDNVIYEFTNAILDDDIDKVKKMYDRFLMENVGVDYLISSLSNSFRISLIIKILYNKNMRNVEIGKVIGKKEFFVKKSLDRLYKYTTSDLSSYISKLAKIDRDIKSGLSNVNFFELFLFCKES